MWPKALVGMAVAAGLLAALALTLFFLGTPMAPQTPLSPATSGGTVSDPAPATPGGSAGPLAIEIPGCVCHSDDPTVVAEHATYRVSQCFDCHGEESPAMGR
jgi:hypothetical protein